MRHPWKKLFHIKGLRPLGDAATRGRKVDCLACCIDQNADRRRAPISASQQWVSPQLQPAPDKHLSAHPAVQFRLHHAFSPSYSPSVLTA
jgi:hypothetical protein